MRNMTAKGPMPAGYRPRCRLGMVPGGDPAKGRIAYSAGTQEIRRPRSRDRSPGSGPSRRADTAIVDTGLGGILIGNRKRQRIAIACPATARPSCALRAAHRLRSLYLSAGTREARKPRKPSRYPDTPSSRLADRQYPAGSPQLPP